MRKGSDIQYENYLYIYKQALKKLEAREALKLVDILHGQRDAATVENGA